MRLTILCVLIIGFVWHPPITAQTLCNYVVATTGDDANPGNQEQPWRTLQHAADVAPPDNTICVLAGLYQEEVEIGRSGLSFLAEGDVTLIGVNVQEGVKNLQLVGFTITGYEIWGITLNGNNQHIELAELDVSGGEAGIHLTYGESGGAPQGGSVDEVLIRDSVIHDTEYTAVDCTPGPCNHLVLTNLEVYGAGITDEGSFGADGIAVERGQHTLVEACYVHDNGGDGIDLNSRDVGEEIPSAAQVVGNRVERNLRNGIKLWHGGEIVNNLMVDNGQTALVVEQGSHYLIINNTIANTQEYGYLVTLGYDERPGDTGLTLYNNIFYNDNPANGGTTLYITETATLDADHNLFYNPQREIDLICTESTCYDHDNMKTILGPNSFYTNPLLTSDYGLETDSPAIGAGDPNYGPDIGFVQ